MSAQEALQHALLKQFTQYKTRNRSYSLRAYAKRLNINSGALSAIMAGSRRVSPILAERLINKMALSPEEIEQIESLFELEKKKINEGQTHTLQLRSDQFHAIVDGIHFSLLCLMETHDYRSDVEWMAKRLGETPTRIKQALTRLERLDLVRFSQKGEWKSTGERLRTSDGVADLAVRRFHEERLEEAKDKLHSVPVDDRDFFASTLAIKKSRLPLAKQLVREFKKKMESVLEKDPKDEVYRICIQVYPVTQIESDNKEVKK
jgi:uncharacterized protein (TIGR02147 family)